jgi:hypothetical protein
MSAIGGPNIIVTDGLVLALDAGNHMSYSGSGNDWISLASNSNIDPSDRVPTDSFNNTSIWVQVGAINTGLTITGDRSFTTSATANGGVSARNILTLGIKYKITVDVQAISGTLQVRNASETGINLLTNISTPGIYVLEFTAVDRSLYLRTSSPINVTFNSISIFNIYNGAALFNGPTFSSNSGGIILFDGVDDGANVVYKYTNTYSISFWIKFTGAIDNNRAIIDMGAGGGTSSVRIYLRDSKIKIQHASGFVTAGVFSSQVVETNIWNYWTILGSGTSCSIYKNGILDNSGTTQEAPNTSFNQVGIASKPQGDASAVVPLSCEISQVTLYNFLLSASEILQNYNATKGRFGL